MRGDADARGVLAGDLDPSVAFMQGRMKVAGAMAPLLDLLNAPDHSQIQSPYCPPSVAGATRDASTRRSLGG